ncbi:hypothetical protein NPIL_433671 [Nephila pilipes]|uniref:Uncharacterized protein n=1 Tax=Nephila pilipes TaxID=299642 RepID=A0A8X6M8Z9_NEPPI|nr:hypothetical protein NPIL_433671 [Nephila pilipes]
MTERKNRGGSVRISQYLIHQNRLSSLALKTICGYQEYWCDRPGYRPPHNSKVELRYEENLIAVQFWPSSELELRYKEDTVQLVIP